MSTNNNEEKSLQINSGTKIEILKDHISIDKYFRDYRRKLIVPFSQIESVQLKYPSDIAFPKYEKSGYIIFNIKSGQNKKISKALISSDLPANIKLDLNKKTNFLQKTIKSFKALKLLSFLNIVQFSIDEYQQIQDIKRHVENKISEVNQTSNSGSQEIIIKEKIFSATKLFIYINLIAFALIVLLGAIFYFGNINIRYFGKTYYFLVIGSIVFFLYRNYRNSKSKDW